VLTVTIRLHSVSTDFRGLLSTSKQHRHPRPIGITGFRVAAERDIHINHVDTARGHRSTRSASVCTVFRVVFGVRSPQPARCREHLHRIRLPYPSSAQAFGCFDCSISTRHSTTTESSGRAASRYRTGRNTDRPCRISIRSSRSLRHSSSYLSSCLAINSLRHSAQVAVNRPIADSIDSSSSIR